jgi:hypothetical protein
MVRPRGPVPAAPPRTGRRPGHRPGLARRALSGRRVIVERDNAWLYDYGTRVRRPGRVSPEGVGVRLGTARYSVPNRQVGARVAKRVNRPRVVILDPTTGQLHAERLVTAPGDAFSRDEDELGTQPSPEPGHRSRISSSSARATDSPSRAPLPTWSGGGVGSTRTVRQRPNRTGATTST